MKNFHYLVAFIVLAPLFSSGQDNKEVAGINYMYIPVKYNDTSLHVNIVDFNIGMSLHKTEKTSISGKLEVGSMSFSNFPGTSPTFYSTAFQGVYTRIVNNNLALTIFGKLGIYSDMKNISANAFRAMVGFQYKIKVSETMRYGLGIAYANQFYGNQLMPYVNMDWHPSRNWEIYGQFPTNIRAEYTLSERDFIGFGINGLKNSYRLSSKNDEDNFVQLSQWTGKLFYEHKVYKHWSFNVNAGYALTQSYSEYNDVKGGNLNTWSILTIPVGKKRPVPTTEVRKTGMVFQGGIAYKIFKNH